MMFRKLRFDVEPLSERRWANIERSLGKRRRDIQKNAVSLGTAHFP